VRRPLSAAAYLAVVGAGTLASVQLWLHAFGVRESVSATELAVPGAHQRAVPEFVLPTAVKREGSVGRPSSVPAGLFAVPGFLSGANPSPSSAAPSTRPATPSTPVTPSRPESPAVVAPQEQPAAAGDTTRSASPQPFSSPTRAVQASVGRKSRSKGRKHPPHASRGHAVHAAPATPAAPAPRTHGGRHAPPKHDAKPAKGGKAPKPAPPSSGGAPGASSGHPDHPGGGQGNGHGK
jgi:hypothetical protein